MSVSLVVMVLIAAGIGYGIASALRSGARRIDERRSVLIHAPVAVVWEKVRQVPDLLLRFGKLIDLAGMEEPPRAGAEEAAPGSRWRLCGLWEDAPYWLEVELIRTRPRRGIEFRLARDGFGTERGLRDHRGSLTLESVGPEQTKLTWRLQTRFFGARLRALHLLSPATLRARLLDLKLRAIKVAVENELPDGAAASRDGAARRDLAPDETVPPPAPSRPPESTL